MLIVYTGDRAERLASSYEKMRNWSVERTMVKVSTGTRHYGSITVERGVYARVFKKGKLQFVIEHEWFNSGSVML